MASWAIAVLSGKYALGDQGAPALPGDASEVKLRLLLRLGGLSLAQLLACLLYLLVQVGRVQQRHQLSLLHVVANVHVALL